MSSAPPAKPTGYLEQSIRANFARRHPDETLEDIKRRACFSKEDKGLLCDWTAIAAIRVATDRIETAFAVAAE
jgi:hypothetical protein